jgi:hypothetical protein
MKQKPKIGDRVELLFINDTWTKLEKGAKGTIFKIEDENSEALIWIKWDNGEKLALIDGIDKYKIIKN